MNRYVTEKWAVNQAVYHALPGICWWLRTYRAACGLSRAQLAARMNITVQRLTRLENGAAPISLDELIAWGAYLEVRVLLLEDSDGAFTVVIDADEFFMRPYFADEPHPWN